MSGAAAPAGVSAETLSAAATEAAQQAAAKLVEDGVPAALAARDASLWGRDAEADAAKSLGWLDAPAGSRPLLDDIARLTERARQDGLDHVVLAGVGGSSLAPEAIARTAGADLTVLDTTDPHQVACALGDRLDSTVVVVSGKTGSAVETDSHRRIYEEALRQAGLGPEEIARRFVVVTDPGSPLEETARKAGYHVVLANPDVGESYSALTAFGLVPSALAGVDVAALLDDAQAAAPVLGRDHDNPGLVLGAALGGFALAGHDKAVIADYGSGIIGFGDWAEQLLAESTGKQGKGILPVVVESERSPGFSPAPDVHLIGLGTPAPGGEPHRPADTVVSGPLGAQFLVWEYATALAGRLIEVNPFDRPDLQESVDNATALLAEAGDGPLPTGEPAFADGAVEVHTDPELLRGAADLPGVLDAVIGSLPAGGYLSVMAYLDRIGDQKVATLRGMLAARTTHPVTFGWGSRFLHASGQYHKGGPQTGAFLQLTGAIERDVRVPGTPYSLGRMQLAQALGDLQALRSRGRPVFRLHLRHRAAGIEQLLAAAAAAAPAAASNSALWGGPGTSSWQPADLDSPVPAAPAPPSPPALEPPAAATEAADPGPVRARQHRGKQARRQGRQAPGGGSKAQGNQDAAPAPAAPGPEAAGSSTDMAHPEATAGGTQ